MTPDQDKPYGPEKADCPLPDCKRRVIVTPAGHILHHFNSRGLKCPASGRPPSDFAERTPCGFQENRRGLVSAPCGMAHDSPHINYGHDYEPTVRQ